MNKGGSVAWIITLFLLGAIGVLIIMNAGQFAIVAGSIFTGFNSWGRTLSGTGYRKAKLWLAAVTMAGISALNGCHPLMPLILRLVPQQR